MIYAVCSHLNCCNSFSLYRASLAYTERKEKGRSQKIDDLPVLVTCQAGASAMLSSKVNGAVVHGSTG